MTTTQFTCIYRDAVINVMVVLKQNDKRYMFPLKK